MVTRKRLYLETMESVLSRNKKVFLDVDSSGNILYLPLESGNGAGSSPIVPPLKSQATESIGEDSPPDTRARNREPRR